MLYNKYNIINIINIPLYVDSILLHGGLYTHHNFTVAKGLISTNGWGFVRKVLGGRLVSAQNQKKLLGGGFPPGTFYTKPLPLVEFINLLGSGGGREVILRNIINLTSFTKWEVQPTVLSIAMPSP